MTWTLYKYLSRDLLRAALLAVLAFTLVMTLFAIIEPLRTQQGLSASQVLRLFGFLVPVMLSLTLPVAALFSATIVYGRFSMDNELTACRAGGVSTLTLLKPALAMAVLVSVISLLLSNWISPNLARRGEEVAKANLKALVYQQLRSQSYWKMGPWLVHADYADPQSDQLQGVVAMNLENLDAVEFLSATGARVEFFEDGADTVALFTLQNPTAGRQDGPNTGQAGRVPFGPVPVPSLVKDSPSFYDWDMLFRVKRDPQHSPTVQNRLEQIRRELYLGNLYRDIAATLPGQGSYELRNRAGERYVLQAPVARNVGGRRLDMLGGAGDGPRPVVILHHGPEGQLWRTIRAEAAVVQARYDLTLQDAQVEVRVHDAAFTVHHPGGSESLVLRKDDRVGPLEMPPAVRDASQVSLEELARNPQSERFRAVRGSLADLRNYIHNRLEPKVAAEMHGRLAYGTGCFLLVTLGAALGLRFRGGQLLSAFAISFVPAMVLIVMTIMGRQLMAHPKVPMIYGVTAIWSGVGLLAATVAYVYGVSARR